MLGPEYNLNSYIYDSLKTDHPDINVIIYKTTIQSGKRITDMMEVYDVWLNDHLFPIRSLMTYDEALTTAWVVRKTVNEMLRLISND